jgi:hypothetical protein
MKSGLQTEEEQLRIAASHSTGCCRENMNILVGTVSSLPQWAKQCITVNTAQLERLF